MKKGLKIGAVALLIAATSATVISTGKVQAEQANTSNFVKVEIGDYNGKQNTCTGTDYEFYFTGSTEKQIGVKTGGISCKFGKSAGQAVTLLLSGDLVSDGTPSYTIPKENIKLTNGTRTSNPSKIKGTDPAAVSDATFYESNGRTLYNKAEGPIGDASGTNIQIEVTVPEGTPNGAYQGTLVLSYGG